MSIRRNSIVITRAPLRVSFVGGGSDLPIYPAGATVAASINKYVYCVAKWRADTDVYLSWRKKEVRSSAKELEHELVREALLSTGINNGIEILTFADVPGVGSGLGSSAATTVAVVKALFALQGSYPPNAWIAARAAHIELGRLGKSGGRQDQYASACGGFLRIDYSYGEIQKLKPLAIERWQAEVLEHYMILFSPNELTGRDANTILKTAKGLPGYGGSCQTLCDVFEAYLAEENYAELAVSIFRHHQMKGKEFRGYFAPKVEGIELGLGWKLCGAGKTGHLLAMVESVDQREAVVEAGRLAWGPELPFSFTFNGAEILYRE